MWAFAALHPRLYALGTKIAVRVLRMLSSSTGLIHRLPFDPGWTQGRDIPAPEKKTFRELYAEQRSEQGNASDSGRSP